LWNDYEEAIKMTTQSNDNKEKLRVIREQMPATTAVHYLNTGTNGPLPKMAADALMAEAEKEFLQGRYLPFIEQLYTDMDITRNLLARIIGASYEEIALTHSATESLNIVLWGLRWQSGDEAVTTSQEHVASLAPLALIKSRHGIVVKYVDVGYGEDYDEDEFLSAVERALTPRTRLFLVSHVSFSTGLTFPIKKLVELCHAHNVYVLVDGAQGVGAIPVNMHDLGVDFYAITGRKWLCGPEGIGVLYVAKSRISEVDPTFISPSSVNQRYDLDIYSPYVVPAPFAGRYQIATAMYRPTLLGFQKSLQYLTQYVGIEWVTARIPGLARYIRDLISEIPGVKIITPPGKEAGLIHFHVKGWNPLDLCNILNEQKFMIRSVPKRHVPAPARISTGFYNTEEELEQLAVAIREMVS
jgi:L-cysteine/cystine lyase